MHAARNELCTCIACASVVTLIPIRACQEAQHRQDEGVRVTRRRTSTDVWQTDVIRGTRTRR